MIETSSPHSLTLGRMEALIRRTRLTYDTTNKNEYSRDVLRIRSQQMRSETSMRFDNDEDRSAFLSLIQKDKPKNGFKCVNRGMRALGLQQVRLDSHT